MSAELASGLSILFELEKECVQSMKDMEQLSKAMKELTDRVERLISALTALVNAPNFDASQITSLLNELNGDLKQMGQLCEKSKQLSYQQLCKELGRVEELAERAHRPDLAMKLAVRFDENFHQELKKHADKFHQFLQSIAQTHEFLKQIASAISGKRSEMALLLSQSVQQIGETEKRLISSGL